MGMSPNWPMDVTPKSLGQGPAGFKSRRKRLGTSMARAAEEADCLRVSLRTIERGRAKCQPRQHRTPCSNPGLGRFRAIFGVWGQGVSATSPLNSWVKGAKILDPGITLVARDGRQRAPRSRLAMDHF